MTTRIAIFIVGGGVLLLGLAVGVAKWDSFSFQLASGEAEYADKPVNQRIDINTASARVLSDLPGMRPELVERIIRHRPYKKLDELITKKVLGRKQFARIKDRIRVGPVRREGVSVSRVSQDSGL